MDLQAEFMRLKQEIRDLKTAQTQPSTFTLNRERVEVPAGTYSGTYTWTVQYEDVGDTNAPITSYDAGSGWSLRPYNSTTNTQKVELHVSNMTTTATFYYIYSTRPMASVTKDF